MKNYKKNNALNQLQIRLFALIPVFALFLCLQESTFAQKSSISPRNGELIERVDDATPALRKKVAVQKSNQLKAIRAVKTTPQHSNRNVVVGGKQQAVSTRQEKKQLHQNGQAVHKAIGVDSRNSQIENLKRQPSKSLQTDKASKVQVIGTQPLNKKLINRPSSDKLKALKATPANRQTKVTTTKTKVFREQTIKGKGSKAAQIQSPKPTSPTNNLGKLRNVKQQPKTSNKRGVAKSSTTNRVIKATDDDTQTNDRLGKLRGQAGNNKGNAAKKSNGQFKGRLSPR